MRDLMVKLIEAFSASDSEPAEETNASVVSDETREIPNEVRKTKRSVSK